MLKRTVAVTALALFPFCLSHAGLVLDVDFDAAAYRCQEGLLIRRLSADKGKYPGDYRQSRVVAPARVVVVPANGGVIVYTPNTNGTRNKPPVFFPTGKAQGSKQTVQVENVTVYLDLDKNKEVSRAELHAQNPKDYKPLKSDPKVARDFVKSQLTGRVQSQVSDACGIMSNELSNAKDDGERHRINVDTARALRECERVPDDSISKAAQAQLASCGLASVDTSAAADEHTVASDDKKKNFSGDGKSSGATASPKAKDIGEPKKQKLD